MQRNCEFKDFIDVFDKVRQEGDVISADEMLKFSKLFKDEITLYSLTRPQLVALCRLLEIRPIGTSNFLKFLLAFKLHSLAIDDKKIQQECIDSLTLSELQQACKSRGMRAYGLTEKRLRQQLSQWLDLSLDEKVPPSLNLLSRVFSISENIPTSDLLNSPPDSIKKTFREDLGEREGAIDNKDKLKVFKEEERKVKEEVTSTDLKTLKHAIKNFYFVFNFIDKDIKKIEIELKNFNFKEDVNNLQEVMKTKILLKKVNKILMNLIKKDIETLEQVDEKTTTESELIIIDKLIGAVRKLQSIPDEEKLKQISEVLSKIDI